MSRIKRPTKQSYPELSADDMLYANLLTQYAFNIVATQAVLQKKVIINNGMVESSEGALNVTALSCHCSFWKMFHLPCRHIFAFRIAKGLCSFDENLVATRWTLAYTASSHSSHTLPRNPSTFVHNQSAQQVVQNKLSSHQKYRRALKICQELASLVSEVGMDEFTERMDELSKIKGKWLERIASGEFAISIYNICI